MAEKLLFWLGSSLEDTRSFPEDARRLAGFQLRRIQQGFDANDWKAVTVIGQGVREIRIHTALEHRILYVAKFEEGVYVLHAFKKRTQRLPRHDLDLARKRFSELLKKRRADAAR
jgi:phage-related protein